MFDREELKRALELYAVTDRAWLDGRTLAACVEDTLRGGATFVQLREKDAPPAEVVLRACTLVPLCRAAGVPIVVDDDVEAARISGADGVHIGQSDTACAEARAVLGPDALVGVSAASVAEAQAAEAAGADYIGVGALASTATKPEAGILTPDELRTICESVSIPVVAIGGLNAEIIPLLAGTGVDGVAVVSALFAAEDIEAATRELKAIVEETLCLKKEGGV
ncbi:MAG: thiamine phosphate synthase [Gordonibacter sp.]